MAKTTRKPLGASRQACRAPHRRGATRAVAARPRAPPVSSGRSLPPRPLRPRLVASTRLPILTALAAVAGAPTRRQTQTALVVAGAPTALVVVVGMAAHRLAAARMVAAQSTTSSDLTYSLATHRHRPSPPRASVLMGLVQTLATAATRTPSSHRRPLPTRLAPLGVALAASLLRRACALPH